jgi:hypothetical protein
MKGPMCRTNHLTMHDSPSRAEVAVLEEPIKTINIRHTGCDDGWELGLREDRRGQGQGRTLLLVAEEMT